MGKKIVVLPTHLWAFRHTPKILISIQDSAKVQQFFYICKRAQNFFEKIQKNIPSLAYVRKKHYLCTQNMQNALDHLKVKADAKANLYQSLLPQIESLISGETDLIANMANIVAVLHNTFHFWWTGFYLVKGNELVLGPFQGPIACTRIPLGKGVCGTAWKNNETVIVPDVHQFPGHIACSSESKSEIVVPIRQNEKIIAVLDIDSKDYNTFDNIDRQYLEQINLFAK